MKIRLFYEYAKLGALTRAEQFKQLNEKYKAATGADNDLYIKAYKAHQRRLAELMELTNGGGAVNGI